MLLGVPKLRRWIAEMWNGKIDIYLIHVRVVLKKDGGIGEEDEDAVKGKEETRE